MSRKAASCEATDPDHESCMVPRSLWAHRSRTLHLVQVTPGTSENLKLSVSVEESEFIARTAVEAPLAFTGL